ncbi:MAG: aminotransferase class V-fold PLP-dependent enzyme [Acidobacteria bacterium]|nr:aminotransferase class V-fold PLP-dependent enzyme [Acidobacteriota bacterium]
MPPPERPGPVYLDCAATCPIDPRVQAELRRYTEVSFGNAGSRTHVHGRVARQAVERARAHVARVARVRRNEVVFTSGATESNNLAILGLESYGRAERCMHLVGTKIEHHAVLEPLRVLALRGFELTLLDPEPGGWIDPERVAAALRPETLLVSVMQVNNETGIEQPIPEIADRLASSPAFLHVDAAQGFGKALAALRHPRVDLISVSGHKICGPKGVGALLARHRDGARPPLTPLLHGGGQELGLRPGTLPVALIAAFGRAAELALEEHDARLGAAAAFGERLLAGLAPLAPRVHGDPARRLPYIVNLSIPGWDKEALIEAWAGLAAISDGAACTSQSYTCSHVLAAMGLPPEQEAGAVRLSWCHLSEPPDLEAMTGALLTGAVPAPALRPS